ncbi:hypothetical protein C0995_016171 [Termitomyces sp. Mi166|nr:hypothetical protein C0995_016171 [Termitomyces sp. Mi166\
MHFQKMAIELELTVPVVAPKTLMDSVPTPASAASSIQSPYNKGKGKAKVMEEDKDEEGEATQKLRKELENFVVQTKHLKLALMAAHDCIFAAHVKQTPNANRRRQLAPFIKDDWVYVSSKNFSYPKGFLHKFILKYKGPYQITKDFGNSSYWLAILPNMKYCGIHNVFHAALLCIHKLNDDQLFLGCLNEQMVELEARKWAAKHIVTNAIFEVLWKAGDKSWMSYDQVKELILLVPHLKLLGDKGKGKAVSMLSTEDDSMAVDPDLVNPSEGDADKDGELMDFLKSLKELAEKKNA